MSPTLHFRDLGQSGLLLYLRKSRPYFINVIQAVHVFLGTTLILTDAGQIERLTVCRLR